MLYVVAAYVVFGIIFCVCFPGVEPKKFRHEIEKEALQREKEKLDALQSQKEEAEEQAFIEKILDEF